MRFDVSSTALLSRLQSISKVIASKNSLPILDSFLFNLEGNKLTMTASDSETRLVTSVDVMNAQGSGVFAVSAKILLEPLKELPEQPLTFDVNDDNLEIFIHFQNGKYNFIGQKGDTYPQQKPLGQNVVSILVDAQTLLNGISRSIFATADDELRPVMNGILVELGDDFINFVASDAHKLVCYRRNDVAPGSQASFILPKKPANLLKNLIVKENATVKLAFDDKNALFTMSGHTLFCRLVEGKYPSYQTVIPRNNPNKLTIDRLEFCNSLKRVAVYANQASSLVKLDLKGNELIISAQDVDYSFSATERLTCVYEGDPITIGFKAIFLIEILSNLSSPDVIFELSDPSRAGLLLPSQAEHEGEDVLMLLMPMMINA